MSELVEKRQELEAKSRQLHQIFTEAGPELDLSKVKCVDGDESHKVSEIQRLNGELTDLGKRVELLTAKERSEQVQKQLSEPVPTAPLPGSTPAPMPSGYAGGGQYIQRSMTKSLGELVTEAPAYKARTRGTVGHIADLDVDVKDFLSYMEMKTLMQTSAGWAPQAIRTGTVVPAALRPVQVLDLIPQGETTQASIVYMEETTATNAAVETAEAAAYAQSTLALTERTSAVRKIASYLPVTDEQLDDIPQVQRYVNERLPFFLRQRLDGQVLTGNGTPPNLLGLLNVSGIQTQAKSTDPSPDAIYKAMVKVRITGRAFPSAVVLHPTDWQNIRLLRTAEGVYIWGSPSEAGPERIWGLPIAQADSLTAGTAVVGDFVNFSELDFRKGISVEVGYVNDDFAKGQKSLRADLRAAIVYYRPAAYCTVTGL